MASTFSPIFAVGDIVRLNSGSPDLTVVRTWPTMDPTDPGKTVNYTEVAWINDSNEEESLDLPEVCFTKVVSDELTSLFTAIFGEAVGALNPPESFEDDGQGSIGIGGGR